MLSQWKTMLIAMMLSMGFLMICGLLLHNNGTKVIHERFAERKSQFDAKVAPLYQEINGLKPGDDLTAVVEKFPQGRSGASVGADKVTISVPRALTEEGGMVFENGTIFEMAHQDMRFVSVIKKRTYSSTSLGERPPGILQTIKLGWESIF